MSRAPKVESAYTPLHASIAPTDVIDFVDNSLQTLAPGVMGGPPAYLEAHGIRYVPATELDSDAGGAPGVGAGGDRPGLDTRIRAFVQAPAGLATHGDCAPAARHCSARGYSERALDPGRSYSERVPDHVRSYSAHDSFDSAPRSHYGDSDPVRRSSGRHSYARASEDIPPSLHRAWSSTAEAAKTERLLGRLQSRAPFPGRVDDPGRTTVASRLAGLDY